jgi:hypothetical protein
MNISKYFKIIFIIFNLMFLFNLSYADNHDELSSLDDELPAIDPFSTGNMGGSNNMSISSSETSPENEILNNLRLVATMLGENDKIVVFAMADGTTMKFKENDFINEEITITRIHDDRVIIERDDKEYKVFMNNLIRPVE